MAEPALWTGGPALFRKVTGRKGIVDLMFRVTAYKSDLAPRGGVIIAAALLAAGSAYAQERGATPAPTGPVVVLEADRVTRDANSNLVVAEGSVEARYEGRLLRAQRLIYDTEKGTLRAQGGVEIVEADGSIRYAQEVEVDEQLNAGVAVGFGSRIPTGGTIAANAAVLRPNGEAALNRVVYTACPVCAESRPTWTLKARRAEQDANSKMIAYEGVTLNVRGAPVLYLPYFAHPDPTSGRRTGLLVPEVGDSRRLGAVYRQPVYIALGRSQDLTLTPSVHAQVDPLLLGRYRKRFYSGDLALSFSGGYAQDFDGEGREFGEKSFRGHVFGGGEFTISDYWGWRFGIERATDDLFLSRYEIPTDDRGPGLYIGNPSRLLSQINVTGQDEVSFVQFSAVTGQGLRLEDDGDVLPTVAPYGEAERIFRDPLFDGQLRLGLSTANVVRQGTSLDSSRVSTQARWRRDTIVGPGLVVSPFAEGRVDAFNVRPSGGKEETFTRTVGLSGVEVRWPLLKATKSTEILLEPIAVATLASSGGNDPRIPNEDSQAFELDETSVFRPSGTPNYDLWEPGGRVAVGMRATAKVGSGEARALAARRWRTGDAPKTASGQPVFDRATNLDENASDYVGLVALDFGRPVRADVRYRLDGDSLDVNRIDAGVGSSLGPLSADVRYFFVKDTLRPGQPNEEVSASASLALSKSWRLDGTMRRDLNLDKNLRQTAALVYQDDCTFLEFSYQREEADERLGPNEGFRIRVGLRTLGFVGDR